MKAAIIGYGEIGSAVAALYRRRGLPDPIVHDPALGFDAGTSHLLADVVHVCVPGGAVRDVVVPTVTPDPLWIVHSTVPVGTCRKVAEACRSNVVHAPVRGVHPNLVAGLEAFTMPVSGMRSVVTRAADHLHTLGIRTSAWPGRWEDTELAKILCTTRYGLDILFMRQAAELCSKFGADFDRVYTEWTKQYSDGFEMLGQWWFRRPVLRPMSGPIGGHCVLPNARMLADASSFAEMVASLGAEDWVTPDPTKATPRRRT